MSGFWVCFVPLFVAVDAFGVLPLFISLTEGIDAQGMKRIVQQSVVTASLVALAFLAVGVGVLRLLNITIGDFMVAGGVMLFGISMNDLLRVEKVQRIVDADSLGVVPLGVPLITGPAVLTTSILLLNAHGALLTGLSLVTNIVIAGVVFHYSSPLHRFLGKAGSKAISKIASLLLAAIAVMMVRKGITSFISGS